MAQLTVSAAARAVGKDRGTIHRYIKTGKLSVAKDTSGHTVVETAELLRVFGMLQGDGEKSSRKHVAQPVVAAVENSSVQHILESTLELLKEQLKVSQEREERLLAMLGQEQELRRELERRLLPPGAPVQDPDPEPVTAKAEAIILDATLPESTFRSGDEWEKKGFFAKLFGK